MSVKKAVFVLVPTGLAAIYAAGYIYQMVQDTLNSVSDLKAKAKISEIYYDALVEAAPEGVREQIINDLEFNLVVMRDSYEKGEA